MKNKERNVVSDQQQRDPKSRDPVRWPHLKPARHKIVARVIAENKGTLATGAARKKAIVAVARQLAVDL